ncbi:MAG: acyl-CoA dehydrogenase family protein [Acidimicrobiales bacterium]|nr:acyl-CoA dehydrogenase family protein [Acidimicrobiales bacterium]
MISVDDFRAEAEAWLAEQQATAPPDWGAIMPPERREQGMAWQQRMHAAGFAGIHWPEELGGRGLTIEHHQAWSELCADAGVPAVLNMVGLVLTGGAIQLFGTDDQKHTHLPPTVKGERVWCQLFSEPEAGSDLAGLTTLATLDGDEWVVSGQKVWCSGGRASDWGILLARTEPAAPSQKTPKHEGISFFLVDMHTPGVETRPLRQMTGEAEFDEVFLDDVRLPADALLGERGQGWTIAMSALTNERGFIGGTGRAIARRLESIRDLATANGRELTPVERDRLVRLYARGKAYLTLSQRQGPMASVNSSLGKLAMTSYVFDLAEFRLDLLGAHGMLEGAEATGFLSAPGGWFGGGTSQVQRNIIGERILGLPREPRPDPS